MPRTHRPYPPEFRQRMIELVFAGAAHHLAHGSNPDLQGTRCVGGGVAPPTSGAGFPLRQ
jgi:hypothetical protein